MDNFDNDVKTSEQMSEDDILSLFKDLKKAAAADDAFRDNALTVEQLSQNRTTTLINTDTLSYFNADDSIAMQELQNIVKSWPSLIVKDRPSVYGVPMHDDDQSVAAAEIFTKYVEYFENEAGVADKWHKACTFAAQGGTGAMKIIFNPDLQKAEWQPLSIFDYWVENAPNPDEVTWCVIKTMINKHSARRLVRTVDPNAGFPPCKEYIDGAGITRSDKVEKYEIYYLPSDAVPDGLYACIIDEHVVESMPYPYIFDEPDGAGQKALLPLVWFTAIDTRGASLGQTFATACAPLQAAINRLFNKHTREAERATRYLLLPKDILESEDFDGEDQFIGYNGAAQNVGEIRWVNPGQINQESLQWLDRLSEKIWETAGMSKVTAGQTPSGTAARAIAYQAEIDANRHADAFKSFERANRSAWELTLKIIQKFYTQPQQFAISGKNPVMISGMDVAGVNVRLEARSERESALATKTETAQANVANGFADPTSLAGINPTLFTASQRMYAKEVINQALSGQDVSPTVVNEIDPTILVEEIDTAIAEAQLTMDIPAMQTLRAFRDFILQSLSATKTADPNAGQSAQPAPTGAPLPETAGQEPLPPIIAG